ncbi:hypothetical protein DFH06DRAFT_1152835 [Mycena polygramma]|nr:hypothetical protein DFH06DRAFT_1152835 [Mycena polygramma]
MALWRRCPRRDVILSESWYPRKRPMVVLGSYDVYRVVAIIVNGDLRIKQPRYPRKRPLVVLGSYDVYRVVAIVVNSDFRIKFWYPRKRPMVVLGSYDVYCVVAIVVNSDFRIKFWDRTTSTTLLQWLSMVIFAKTFDSFDAVDRFLLPTASNSLEAISLKMVSTHQSRLPREFLQTGLRLILMNLVDPKCLLVLGLGGLACLLELLTNYFKVEVGHKLLDHFRIVADLQLLMSASKLTLAENEGIIKLVRLVNMLPSAANIFLENLVNLIVQTESRMHFSGKTPFPEPLARYLNRYPVEGIDFFLRHFALDSHLRRLWSILQDKLAPNLRRELVSRVLSLVAFVRGDDPLPNHLLTFPHFRSRTTHSLDNGKRFGFNATCVSNDFGLHLILLKN